MPGQANTFSTSTAPENRKPTRAPITVMTGSSALGRAWRSMTPRWDTPLALAKRT